MTVVFLHLFAKHCSVSICLFGMYFYDGAIMHSFIIPVFHIIAVEHTLKYEILKERSFYIAAAAAKHGRRSEKCMTGFFPFKNLQAKKDFAPFSGQQTFQSTISFRRKCTHC